MNNKYITITRFIRKILRVCQDGVSSATVMLDENNYAVSIMLDYVKQDLMEVKRLWPEDLDNTCVDNAIMFLDDEFSFETLSANYLPEIENKIDTYYENIPLGDINLQILELLHPRIIDSSFFLFKEGKYRDSVLNSIISVYDLVREKSGVDSDGTELVGKVFSLQNPILILSDLTTESGKNDQKGFIQLLQGAYIGIRNPKAHSLEENLDKQKAAQYLIFSSILARRVEDAEVFKNN